VPTDDLQHLQPLQRKLVTAALTVTALIALIAVYGYATGAPWVGMATYTYDTAGRITGFGGYKTFWDWLELLIVPLALALGGGLIAVFVTRWLEARRERVAWSTRIAEEYLGRFEEHSRVRAYFLIKEGDLTPVQKLNIKAWGNWLEFVALLCNLDMADTRLMRELGIDDFIREFRRDAGRYRFLDDARRDDWRHIARF
jgi:hypothetical protein